MFLIPSPAMSFLCYSALENTKDHFWILLRLTRFALMCTPPPPWFSGLTFLASSEALVVTPILCLTGTRYPTDPITFKQYPNPTQTIFRIIGYF